MPYIHLTLALILNIAANIAMKLAAAKGIDLNSWSPLVLVQKNWLTITSIGIYGASALFYFLTLRQLPLSVAYPAIIFTAFTAIQIFSVIFLHEKIAPWQIVGAGMIVIGVLLILYNAKK